MIINRNSTYSIFLAIIITVIFWPGLSGGFLLDDIPNIVGNSAVQAETWSLDSLQRALYAYEGPIGRPLATLSFAINHLLTGLDPWWLKATNLCIHVLNSLLIGILAKWVLLLGWKEQSRRNVSLVATVIALVWAIHPLQVSSVLYIVQRMEILAASCTLLALLAYINGRRRQLSGRNRGWYWLAASACLTVLGMASKEVAILTPLYTFAIELTLFRFAACSSRDRMLLRAAYAITMLVLVIALVTASIYAMPAYATRDFTVYERIASQFRILAIYLQWMIWPSPSSLTFYHDNFVMSQGLLTPWTTLVCMVFLGLLSLAALLMRNRYPVSSLGIMLFFFPHVLTSGAIPLEPIFEHRNYFALFGIVMLAADLLFHALPKNSTIPAKAAVIALALGFGLTTTLRTATWGSSLSLAVSMAEHNPASARAAFDLAIAYFKLANYSSESPIYPKAIQAMEHAGSIPGSSPLPEQALILLASNNREPIKESWWRDLQNKIEINAPGSQEFTAIYALHASKMKGSSLPADRLQPLYEAFLINNPNDLYMNLLYSDFARVTLKDERLAMKHRNIAISISSK